MKNIEVNTGFDNLMNKCKDERLFLQSTIDSMSDSVMVIRLDGTVVLNDKDIQEKAKYANISDIENPKCYEIYHNRTSPCKTEEYPCPLQDVLRTKEKTTILHKDISENGKITYLEMVATPVYNKNKEIIGIVESTRDITSHLVLLEELKNQTKVLSFKANHDNLTGLPNRTLFMDRLDQGIEVCKRTKTSLAVLFIDLDNFKFINDTYGHKIGDEVLKKVTERISLLMRASDTFSRLGGDEFTIILNGIENKENISNFTMKILKALNEQLLVDSYELTLSCSIGISIYDDDIDATELLDQADSAMYRAKNNGKNDFKFYL